MLFDGDCGFCSGSVRYLAARSRSSRLHFCPMQSELGQALLQALDLPTDHYESLVLVEAGKVRLKSDAVLRIGELMVFPWPLLAAVARRLPEGLLDRLYDLVARNRYRILGRRDLCSLSSSDLAERLLR